MLLYALPIWVDATLLNWCKAKLRSVLRLMLNSSIGSFRSTSLKSALILANETPIEMRAQELAVISSLKGYHSSSKIVRNIFANIDINILNIDFPCPSFHSSHPPFELSPALTINTTANYPSLLPNSENEFYVFTDYGSLTSDSYSLFIHYSESCIFQSESCFPIGILADILGALS